MWEFRHDGKYLGTPFCKFRNKSKDFNYIAERFATKLAGWKLKHLSLAGRNILIKSVALAVPIFVMQVFLLLVCLCDKLDRFMRRFLWGATAEAPRVLILRAWDNICASKLAGGLGIRRMWDMNIAFITKLGWKICIEPQKTWVKLIRSKYLRGRRVTDFQRTNCASTWFWNGIVSCKESLQNGLCVSVGQHSVLRIREDPWLSNFPLFNFPTTLMFHPQFSEWLTWWMQQGQIRTKRPFRRYSPLWWVGKY